MASVKQKGVQDVQPKTPTQPQTTNPDDYIDQYLQSQLQAPDKPYQAGDPTNYNAVQGVGNVLGNVEKGDLQGALGTGFNELTNFISQKDKQNQNYQGTADYTAKLANETTDPYMRQALLDQYQQRKGGEAAQIQAYNDLIKERGKNALDTVKFKGTQELERDKTLADLKKAELDRQMQAYIANQRNQLEYTQLPGKELTPEEKLVFGQRAVTGKNVPLKNKFGKLAFIPGLGGKQIDKKALAALVAKENPSSYLANR